MIFIDPSLEEVYQVLVNNDKIVNFLKEQRLLLTKSNLYESYSKEEIDNMTYAIFTNNVNTLYDVAQVLLDNEEIIKEKSIPELLAVKLGWDELSIALGIQPHELTADVYKNIIYTYKYCTVSSFFQNNRDKFIPEGDLFELENNPAAEAFLDAMMKEFDKLDIVLGKCCEYLDYDKIPWDLITYLTQMLGYEKTTFNIKEENKFRELAKNILDLYRMKGTGYSFELFFNFLGFNIKIREFYFDRRLYYLRTAGNLETGSSDMFKSEFYLTASNPTNNDIVDSSFNEVVLPSDITPQYSLDEFDELCHKYGPSVVLGYTPIYYTEIKDKDGKTIKVPHTYTGKVYKYFKTNLIYYDISLDSGNPTSRDYKTITKCLDFLTPSYIRRGLKVKTNTGEEEEELSFDGDGTKPSINGNFHGFDLLDSEDWSQEYKTKYTKDSKVLDPYGYTGINNNDSKDERYIDYNNSLINVEAKGITKGTDFRLPIGYRLINKSANRFLTGTGGNSGDAPEIYNEYKRLKFMLIPKLNGVSVPYNTPGAIIYPYYTVPPFIDPSIKNYKDVPNIFKRSVKPVSLTGNYKENIDDEDESTVKSMIKSAHITKPVKVTNLPIKDCLSKELSTLGYGVISNRELIDMGSFSYKTKDEKGKPLSKEEIKKNIKDCYDKNIKNYYHISNIRDIEKEDEVDNIPSTTDVRNFQKKDVFKNFEFGKYVIAKDDSALRVYYYGNRKIPSKRRRVKDGKDINYYDKTNYDLYNKDARYNLVKAQNGRVDSFGYVRLPGSTELNKFSDAFKNIDSKLKEMRDSNGTMDLNHVTNSLFYIKSKKDYYRPIRAGIESRSSNQCYYKNSVITNHNFNTLKDALNHFNTSKEMVNNMEFYVKGNVEDWDNLKEKDWEYPNLYAWSYTKRKAGDLIYSTKDEKLYILTGTSDFDYKELKDFHGRLEFYIKDPKGKFVLDEVGTIREDESSKSERYSIGYSDSVSGNMVAQIDLYDESWIGYDEQSDEEEFIFYNSPHLVKYLPGKIFSKDELGNIIPIKIGRPIKALTDKMFDEDQTNKNQTDDKDQLDEEKQTIGQNIIEDLCESTVDKFNNSEISQWDLSYEPVPNELIKNLNPSDYDLYIKSGDSFSTAESGFVEGTTYYSYMTNGFASIAERNAEDIIGEGVEDNGYDYYSDASSFLKDYYKIISLNDFSVKNFPDKFQNDYVPNSEGEYTEKQKEKIKKYFNIAILQMNILLGKLYNNRICYYKMEGKWVDKLSYNKVGIWDRAELPKYCPKLDNLWSKDPIAADPYNPMFFEANSESEDLKQYFKEYNLPIEEIEGLKRYWDSLTTEEQEEIETESKALEIDESGKFYYGFDAKTKYLKNIVNEIELLNKKYGDIFSSKNFNANKLGLDYKSFGYYKKYDNYDYYYKRVTATSLNINTFISSDVENNIYIPYVLGYGFNNFSKDYYGENKEIYSEFSELLTNFAVDLPLDDKNNISDFLKQVLYNNLVKLYRESFIKDEYPVNVSIKGLRPFLIHPKISEKFNGRAGTFFMRNTLRSSYINNGGKKDTDIRLPFWDPKVLVDKNGKTIMSFKTSPKEFGECFGGYWNPYYNEDLKVTDEEKQKIISKLFSCVRPFFNFTENSLDFYGNKKDLTPWQRFRRFLSRDFPYAKIMSFDKNNKPINNELGEVIDSSGNVIKDKPYDRIKEVFDKDNKGYVKITLESYDILKDLHGEVPELSKHFNDGNVSAFNMISDEEGKYVNGFLSIRRLKTKFIDNYLSFPESLKWIELDENYIADEFSSLGEDRDVSMSKELKYSTDRYYRRLIDSKNIENATFINCKDEVREYEKPRQIVKFKLDDGTEVKIPSPNCSLVINENGRPAIKIPFNMIKTSEITDITIIYDELATRKLTKRRKV